jgi:hypothetical protein
MTPFAHESEAEFAQYLEKHGLKYEREVKVDPGDVDFVVYSGGTTVFCDVKAVIKPPETPGNIEASKQIRKDIQKLRSKFKNPPDHPCVLVAMNYSYPQIFTGFTIRTAMFGAVGILFQSLISESSAMLHLLKGGAAFTDRQCTSISGILVIDYAGEHCYFHNPYARTPLLKGFFPVAAEFALKKKDEFALNDPMFEGWNRPQPQR